MQAVILSIGDELVLGQTVDTNAAWLSAQLARRGIGTARHVTVADDCPTLVHAIEDAARSAAILLITGGLGPTEDDLTRQALTEAMGVELVLDQPSVAAIEAFFEQRGREMPARNRVQAMHPLGTTMIPNGCGTAPGIAGRLHEASFYAMPGVPREMKAMFEQDVLPHVLSFAGSRHTIMTGKVNTFGMGESDVADLLGPLMDRSRNPKVGTTVADAIVGVRIRSEFPTADQTQAAFEDTAAEVEAKLGPIVFGRDDHTMPEAVLALLRQRGAKLTTAESCTGGLIGKMITDIAGSSDAYAGGWVTYANAMKVSQLGVNPAILDQHGAVSQPVARAMAAGALRRSGADVAVSVTGVAGPGGGSPDKPVGTVWIGLAHQQAASPGDVTTDALRFTLPGDRDSVRLRTALCALQLVRLHLMGSDLQVLKWGRREPTP